MEEAPEAADVELESWDDAAPSGGETVYAPEVDAEGGPGPLASDPRFATLQQLFPGSVVEWREVAADKAPKDHEDEPSVDGEADTIEEEDDGA